MRLSTLSDQEIVARLRQSYDAGLLGELLQRYRPRVVEQCYRYTQDWEVAKDLTQAVFLNVCAKFQDFRFESSFATWLYTIAHHRSMDYLRRSKYRYSFQEGVGSLTHDSISTNTCNPKKLQLLLNELSGDDRQLVLMKYQHGLTTREVHQLTGLSECAVKTRLCRARKKLRRLVVFCQARNLGCDCTKNRCRAAVYFENKQVASDQECRH